MSTAVTIYEWIKTLKPAFLWTNAFFYILKDKTNFILTTENKNIKDSSFKGLNCANWAAIFDSATSLEM